MNVADNFAREYTAAMQMYLAGGGEDALRRAYEAGRCALANGLDTLRMLATHQESVMKVMESASVEDLEHMLESTLTCFAESLSPFEMVLRGDQEAVGDRGREAPAHHRVRVEPAHAGAQRAAGRESGQSGAIREAAGHLRA